MTTSPVKSAKVAEEWLRSIVSPLPSHPSVSLERMLVIRDKSVVDELIIRANVIVTALFPTNILQQRLIRSPQGTNLMERLWSVQKRSETLKLYYKVLESVCKSEAQKLNTGDFRCLLANERFHVCLISCCADLVSVAQTGTGMLLPVVFERTGITAFDLIKVVESLIIHGPTLPRELRRHLNSLEEQLLESRMWEKGSSLYNSLILSRPDLSDEINRLQLLAQRMPSLDATVALHNPVSSKRDCSEHDDEVLKLRSPKRPKTDPPPASPSLHNAFMSPSKSNAQHGGVTCSETALNIFFSKMTKLAAMRIQSIAERLKLSQQFREKIYFLFQQILAQRTSLFFNRHIDQIILCYFYGLAKVSKFDLTFRKIIDSYMKQPQCRSQVFHCVPSNHEKNGRQCVGIIIFYNELFVPCVNSILKECIYAEPPPQLPGIKKNDDCLSTPHQMSPFPSLPDISPKKVTPSQNIYLSTLQPSKKDALNANATKKSHYAFVGESTRPYESPSKQLSAINKCLNKAPKARCMLNFDNADAAMISDHVVAKSLLLQKN